MKRIFRSMATLHLNNQRARVCGIKVKLVFEVSGLTGTGRDESLGKAVCSALIDVCLSQLVTSPPSPPPPPNSVDKKITYV